MLIARNAMTGGGVRSWRARQQVGYAPNGGMSGGMSGGGLTTAARSAFGQAIDQFKPGGGYMQGIEAGLERGRTKAVASGMSGLVSAGMSNTTQAGGLGKRYEEEIGAPTRAGAETQRMQSLAGLYAGLGGAEQSAFEGSANRGLSLTQSMMANRPAGSGYGAYRPLPTLAGTGGGNRFSIPNRAPSLA